MADQQFSRRAFLQRAALGAGAVAGSALLAACGGSPPATTAPQAGATTAPAAAAATTAPAAATEAPAAAAATAVPQASAATGGSSFMTVSSTDEQKIFDQLAAKFNEQNPGAAWSFDRVPGSWEDFSRKYTTELAGGAPHDAARIAIIQRSSYITKGYLNDLTPFAERDKLNYDDYLPGAFDDWRVDGKLYAIPAGIYNMAVYYNKDMFDKAGIPHLTTKWDDPAWDWNAFREVAKKLTSGEGGEKQYGVTTSWDIRWIIQFVWQNGGDFTNKEETKGTLSDPAAVEALKFVQDMVREDKSWLTPIQLGTDKIFEQFQTGKIGMYINGMWDMPGAAKIDKFKWGVAPLPKGKQAFTGVYIDSWVMPPGVKDPEMSWKFLKFMASADAQNLLVDNSALGVPILKSVAAARSKDLFKPLPPEEQQVWLDASKYSHSFPFTKKWDELYEALKPAWDLWGLGEIDAQQLGQQIDDAVNPILSKA